MKDLILELRAVRTRTEGDPPLDLALPPGSVTALLQGGRRRRSVMVDLITGLAPPAEGTVYFRGEDLYALSERKRLELRGRMGVVTEPPVFLNNVRLMENLRLPLRYHSRMSRRAMDEILTGLLDRLGMQRFEDAIPSRFDDAFRYGAAVVRALAPAPDLLVMERPREGLGEEGTSLLPDLWKEGVTNRGGAVLLLVESGETATTLADRVLLFRKNGTIEETETTRSDARRETEK